MVTNPQTKGAIFDKTDQPVELSKTKVCSRCKMLKTLHDFSKASHRKDGLNPYCKSCNSELSAIRRAKYPATEKAYYLNNRDTVLKRNREYYERNKPSIASRRREYRSENAETLREINAKYRSVKSNKVIASKRAKEWRIANYHKFNSYVAKRRAQKIRATPKWLTPEHFESIDEMYEAAWCFRVYTGQEYQVDHIVPLTSKVVCGLHVPWNLQILSAKENNFKRNSRWPDMWPSPRHSTTST